MPYPRGIWNPEPLIPDMDHTPGFKESAFSWAMARVILWHIAQGHTVRRITRDPKLPAYCTVFQWMKVVPEFGEAVAEARAKLAAKALYTRVRGCVGFRAAFVDACNWRADFLGFEAEEAVYSFRTVGYRVARARYEALVARKGRLTPKMYRKIG